MWGSEERARRRRAEEMERRLQELDRIDALYGLGTMPSQVTQRRRRRSVLPLVLIGAMSWWGVASTDLPSSVMTGLRSGLGMDPPSAAPVDATGSLDRVVITPADPVPPSPPPHATAQNQGASRSAPPVPEPSPTFSPNAPTVVSEGGTYAFLNMQPDGSEPITWDPCEPIYVVVNPQGAPANYETIVASAISKATAASGMDIHWTDETADRRWNDRDRHDPVLVLWAYEDEVPHLSGITAGVASPSWWEVRPGYGRTLTASIALDIAAFDDPYLPPGVDEAIILHELTHVLGLNHVNDPGELMHTTTSGQYDYGPGDLEGLARLGNVPCG